MPSWLARKPNELVESPGVMPRLVAGELHHPAPSLPAFGDGPFEQPTSQSFAPAARRDPHTLDLATPHAQTGQARNERDLQASDDGAADEP